MKAGGEADCGGDAAFGDVTGDEGGGSAEADEGGKGGGDEGKVGGVAGLADAFVGDALFDVVVWVWGEVLHIGFGV